MSDVSEETTLECALVKYGNEAQLRKLTEELAELIVAIQHLNDPHREREDPFNELAEEVADVEIMLVQLHQMYPQLSTTVAWYRRIKVERLRKALVAKERE